MKTTTLGVVFVALAVFGASLLVEAWVLGLILSWFGVSLTFWQNVAILLLANAIFKPIGGSK